MNSECQANSVTTRVRQAVRCDRRRRSDPGRTGPCRPRCARKSASSASKCAGDIALLLSHQTVGRSVASRTMNLSLGERPVCCRSAATSAPWAVSSRLAAADRLLGRARPRRDCSGPCPMVVSPAVPIPQAGLRVPVSFMLSPCKFPPNADLRRNASRSSPPINRKTEKSCDIQIINRFKDFENSFKSFIGVMRQSGSMDGSKGNSGDARIERAITRWPCPAVTSPVNCATFCTQFVRQ